MSEYLIIGSERCAYCNNAKALLHQKALPFEYTLMNNLTSREVTELEEIAGTTFRTVPQIFIEEDNKLTYIGGYSELAQSFRSK